MMQPDWIDFANEEIEAANILFEMKRYNMSCYFAQQIAEKSLRIFLMYNDIPPIKTHNLVMINELCSTIDSRFEKFFPSVALLNQFYNSTRPDEFSEKPWEDTYSKDLAEKSFYHAKKITEFCRDLIQLRDNFCS